MEVNKPVLLRLRPEHWNRFKEEAGKRGMPLTVWILQACLAYDATADRWEKKKSEGKKWPKCSMCGKKHDRNDHFGE